MRKAESNKILCSSRPDPEWHGVGHREPNPPARTDHDAGGRSRLAARDSGVLDDARTAFFTETGTSASAKSTAVDRATDVRRLVPDEAVRTLFTYENIVNRPYAFGREGQNQEGEKGRRRTQPGDESRGKWGCKRGTGNPGRRCRVEGMVAEVTQVCS